MNTDLRKLRTPSTAKHNQDSQNASAVIFSFLDPLDNIHLSAEMLKTIIPSGDEEVYLDVILRNATRMDNLIKSFFIPLQPGELPLEENSIHQLLNEVLEIAKEGITRKQIVISKVYGAPVNKTGCNQQAMKIALMIIFTNVINSIGTGGQLKLETKLVHDKFVLRIEDNGPGINELEQESGGAGLGLATAFYILRSNHISVDVEYVKDQGTNFVLMFKATPISTQPVLEA
jgi:signal transduction histidine kinase